MNPKAYRYNTKEISENFDKNFIINLIAIKPEIVADIVPITKGSCRSLGKLDGFIIKGNISLIAAPAIVGTAIKNANLAASVLFRPSIIPDEIIIPDLLVPGISEIACAKPKTKASVKLTEDKVLICFAFFSEYIKYKETRNSINDTSIGERKAVSTRSENKNPETPAGIEDINTNQPSFCS